ncbi:MAG: DUF4231 domain-containing protein [Deltaproteobacteria bacterium]|nr:DUF4231 domain-containing protein [Deltaproteobacteria bacterium]
MDPTEFDKYLTERYHDQVKWYGEKAATNKRLYQVFQWSVIVLSSALPVFIASLSPEYRWTTVGIAIGTAGLKTFKFQELWISYRTIAETLKKEEHFYRAQIGDYQDADDREALFVERVESLISKENTLWVITHMQKDGEEKRS